MHWLKQNHYIEENTQKGLYEPQPNNITACIHTLLSYSRLSNATPIDAVVMVAPYPACPSWCFPEEKCLGVCKCV